MEVGLEPASPRVATTRQPARLAVFDYDGTIVDGQSGLLFSRYLFSRHLISLSTAGRLMWWGIRYKLRLPCREGEARELIFRDLGARGYEEALRIMREFHEVSLVPRYRADAIAEVGRRRKEGCVTVLVSATFQEIARVAADALGLDGVVATRMELDDHGHFTGRVEGEVVAGQGKCRAITRWADGRFGAGHWLIAFAYGDHLSDEPLLEQAEYCFAVCPGKTMRHQARQRGWPVLDWK